MKNFSLFLKTGLAALFLLLTLNSCDNDRDVNLATDQELREDVYDQILNDEELFTEFMEEMRESEKPMQWMAQHKPMMRNMFTRNQMRRTMRNDPDVIDSVMQGMMYVMEEDTTMFRRNPEMHQRMMQHIMMMMERDTAMYGEMQRRMQQHQMGKQ
ncbi:hypothetical protein [Salinimicrobium soli]|uniref:hypothetical protein n=1 Tax=Salinimicrobium soli TaxID=1254399 RepID=UPI003AAB0074